MRFEVVECGPTAFRIWDTKTAYYASGCTEVFATRWEAEEACGNLEYSSLWRLRA